MLTVHHLGISQSERIVWLCEELGIDYELVRYDRDPLTRLAPAQYKALHPLGIAPVITDGTACLAESGAIIEYIVAKYGQGRLIPKQEEPDFADFLFWFHFANGTLMATFMVEMVMAASGGDPHSATGSFVGARTKAQWKLMEDRLGVADYFAGDNLTAADIMMLFPLTTGRAFMPFDLSSFPNVRAYLQRVGDRPAYQRAMAKAEPGMTPVLT